MQAISSNLASNIRRLRDELNLSQQQIARRAGVPRPTWANLESGEANPTISVLTRVAAALNVQVEDLLRPPSAAAELILAEALPSRRRGKVAIRSLLPRPLVGLEIERLVLPPKAHLVVDGHSPGTHKYATCEVGEVELMLEGSRYRARAGDVLVFRADEAHTLKNPGRTGATVYCVVSLAGSS